MFVMHATVLFALSVLLASTVLVIWSLRNSGAGSGLGKTIGSLVFILSLISLLCISYYGIKYWSQGNFETPTGMSMMMQKDMMQMHKKMMENMGQMGQMGNMGMPKGETHPRTMH